MQQKKLMLLGGISYLLPVIKLAQQKGIYVMTADYLPDNVAHRYSDEYVNVSIIDKDAVLKVARENSIDGIMSFGVDPGVVSAAYVAEKMGLPFQCSYQAACILQDKSRFRSFLKEHGFNVPQVKDYTVSQRGEISLDSDNYTWPVIVKPVDSAGSKGVTKVVCKDDLDDAVDIAFDASISGHIIVEEFLEKEGFSAGSESFVLNGKLMYNGFYDQYFDADASNPFTPSAECWPSVMKEEYLTEVRSELQRLFDLLKVRTGLFNVEFRHCVNGKTYLMEVSPRAGGNRLAEMLAHAADVDIIEAEMKKSIGEIVDGIHEPEYKGHFAICIIRSEAEGILEGVEIAPEIERFIIEKEIRIEPGTPVKSFTGANAALGTLFLRFDTRSELEQVVSDTKRWLKVKVR